MNIELVRLTTEHKEQLFDMLTEWKNDIIENHTDRSPWKIWANDFHNFEYYIEHLDTKEKTGIKISVSESQLLQMPGWEPLFQLLSRLGMERFRIMLS